MPEHALIEQLDQAIDAILAGAALPAAADPELAALAQVAGMLRDMPDERFQTRLKTDLQRRASMPASLAVRTIREGFRTVTPYISVVEGDRLIEFLKQTFDAEETVRHPGPVPGAFHAEIRIGDSMLMIGSGERLRGNESPTAIHIFVDDPDATYARALAAGATSLGEVADRPYGERSGYVKDAAGNHWFIAKRFPNVPGPQGAGNIIPFLYAAKARVFIDFLKRAFGAEELMVYEHAGKVVHAAVRVGDAVLEMGEAPEQRMTSAFFMYVDAVDDVYQRALDAGAASIHAPVDQPYGHREAALRDAEGYVWYPATLI